MASDIYAVPLVSGLCRQRLISKLIRPRERVVVHAQDFDLPVLHAIRHDEGRIGNYKLPRSSDAAGAPDLLLPGVFRKSEEFGDRARDLSRHPDSGIRIAPVSKEAQRAKVLGRAPRPFNGHALFVA